MADKKFCNQVGYMKPWDDKLAPNKCGYGRFTQFRNFGPQSYLWTFEARHCKWVYRL